jgi:hypothetical protein
MPDTPIVTSVTENPWVQPEPGTIGHLPMQVTATPPRTHLLLQMPTLT